MRASERAKMIELEAIGLTEVVDNVIQRMHCGDHGNSMQTLKETVKSIRANCLKLVEEVEDDGKRW